MGQFVLVRHGQASFAANDYDKLTELGLEQSRLLGNWFAHCGRRVDVAIVGGMRRHRQTAEALLSELPPELKPQGEWRNDEDFNEYDADEVVARHRPDLAQPEALRKFLAGCENPRRVFHDMFTTAMDRWMCGRYDCDYRESWLGFKQRCVAALESLSHLRGKTIVVFTSGGPIAAICQHLLQLPDRSAFEINTSMVNSSATGVRYGPGMMSLSFLNNFAHLEKTGNPRVITYR